MSVASLPPRVVAPDDGRILITGLHDTRVLMSSADTGGAYSLFEITSPPGDGPPMHVHSREDETFVVLEGDLDVTVGGQTHRIGPGGSAFAPRGVPHRFANPGKANNRILVLCTPGGFEAFFEEVDSLLGRGVAIEPETFKTIVERHGMKLV